MAPEAPPPTLKPGVWVLLRAENLLIIGRVLELHWPDAESARYLQLDTVYRYDPEELDSNDTGRWWLFTDNCETTWEVLDGSGSAV